MAIEAGTFDSIIPCRYISFTLPVLSLRCPPDFFHTKDLQISVLDSPTESVDYPKVAAMLVPKNREKDWIFTTEAGHLQLLLSSPGISRLILIGNTPVCDEYAVKTYRKSVEKDPTYMEKLERSLFPLLMALLPKEVAEKGNFEVPFLSYEDNVISSVIIERCVGPCVGEMLVEDVEIEGPDRVFRRRLRFKRLPNLVQTEILITPNGVDDDCFNRLQIEEVKFCPDLGVLVHPYLAPMVAGLSLISGHMQELFQSGVKPRAFCLGVGGGALLSFLSKQLGFEVIGVELDDVVLTVAKQYFGLQPGRGIQIYVGDGIDILKQMSCCENGNKSIPLVVKNVRNDSCGNVVDVFRSKFDVLIVDLDSSDYKMGISAPALEFVQKDVLLAAKWSLSEHGILVLNAIPPNRSFYDTLIQKLQEVFADLYEIDCGNEENFVLIASMSPNNFNPATSENAFMGKLKSVISRAFMDSIKKI